MDVMTGLEQKAQKETSEIQTSISLRDGFAKFSGRVIIALRTKGCSWARDLKGGCTHCAIPFSGLCSMDHINILPQFLEDFVKYNFEDYPVLCLYTPGSFFDDEEISTELRIQILEIISKDKSIKRLAVESRPDYITEEKIGEVREILPNMEIEVGLGLDSADDRIRNLLINKGLSFESYVKACDILNRFEITIVTYVLVKPPFLTESEAIIDAIDSAKKAFELGSSVVSFEPMSVQENTVVYQLYKDGLYRPPWLWSVIEIIRNVSSLGDMRIGQFVYPPAVRYASNCDKCTPDIWRRIQEFNRYGNIEVFDEVKCDCRVTWEKYIDNNTEDKRK